MKNLATQIRRKALTAIVKLAILGCGNCNLAGQEVLVPSGSTWRYSDAGPIAEGSWRDPIYDDAAWKSGPAQLGYGEGDESTVVGYGTVSNNKFITTYFRHSFVVSNVARFGRLQGRLLRDDGAVVYLNGAEVTRHNLPAGTIGGDTRALSSVAGADEKAFFPFLVGTEALVEGMNVLAVEIHQNAANSSDLSFDLELIGEWVPLEITPVPADELRLTPNNSAALAVSVTDPASLASNVNVRFYLRQAGPPPGSDFAIVVGPDTQNYAASLNGGTPAMFAAQTAWIVTNQQVRNIAFVTHVGDVVQSGDNGGNNIQWLQATNALYLLEDPLTTLRSEGIPYGIAPGNHDQSPGGSAAGSTTFYNQFFGTNHFAPYTYYGGHYGSDNDNHYELFSAGGLDFIILHLEYDPGANPAVLAWANDVLQAHPQRRAIVSSHYLIGVGNPGRFGTQGQAIYDALKGNPNLFLMLCGHEPGEGRRQDTFDGRTVHTLLADYQARTNGGDGWLRILEFSPSNNVIRVRTYSPWLDRSETDTDSEFTIDYDMSLGGQFTRIAEAPAVAMGQTVFWACTNLAPGTTYEWYVSAQDGLRTQTSPVWRFTPPGGGGNSIVPPPVLKILTRRMTAAGFELAWQSVPGHLYRVCFKQDLGDAAWTDLSENIQANSEITSWTDPTAVGASRRFYAVRLAASDPQ